MGVQYETIRAEVERVRNFITTDLDLVVNQNIGGNYLAASLITCACDAIAYLKYGRPNHGELFFAELLAHSWKPAARGLYDAIRNGIVHVYDTKTIVLGSRRLNISLSWRTKRTCICLQLAPTSTSTFLNWRKI